jgi:hypothetical protein
MIYTTAIDPSVQPTKARVTGSVWASVSVLDARIMIAVGKSVVGEPVNE